MSWSFTPAYGRLNSRLPRCRFPKIYYAARQRATQGSDAAPRSTPFGCAGGCTTEPLTTDDRPHGGVTGKPLSISIVALSADEPKTGRGTVSDGRPPRITGRKRTTNISLSGICSARCRMLVLHAAGSAPRLTPACAMTTCRGAVLGQDGRRHGHPRHRKPTRTALRR
jgi:hypothetical protein